MDNKTENELFRKSGCLIKIRSLYPALPKVHKRIADLVLDDPKQIIGLTITEFANKVDASEASIIVVVVVRSMRVTKTSFWGLSNR